MTEPRRTSRRSFLRGGAAREESGRQEDAAPLAIDPTQEPYLFRVGRRAMACEFQLFLNAGQYTDGAEQALRALDLVDELEAQLTIYRDDSEVSLLNQQAARESAPVERGLFDLLAQAVQLHEETHGAFDITSGPLSHVWGFSRRAGRMPSDDELAAALAAVDGRAIELDPYRCAVRFTREGVQINLGGIGKGYALDRAAELLAEAGVADFVFHGGNSSVIARGNRAGIRGWRVGLVHPLRPTQRLGELTLVDQALSTSGSGTQFFTHAGRRYGHIFDPRTGRPVSHVLSTTVLAPTAAEADALSTALYVLSRDEVAEYAAAHPDITVLIVYPGKTSGAIDLATFNLAEDQWRQVNAPRG